MKQKFDLNMANSEIITPKKSLSSETFINLDLGRNGSFELLKKHLLFSFLWVLLVFILIFRIDVYAINVLPKEFHWIIGILPIVLISTFFITILSQKWYYSLALIFYPVLFTFWFLPKFVLDKGKIYLFGHYVNYIYGLLANFKRTILYFLILCITIILLCIVDSNLVRIISLVIISLFYCRFVLGYLKSSFQPAYLFGTSVEKALEEFLHGIKNGIDKNDNWVLKITNGTKKDEELPEEEQKQKKLTKLILWNYGIKYLSKNLSGFKGKKAYVISWILQLCFFLVISIVFFTFSNYQLYHINPLNFKVQGIPNIFEFFYYTLKSFTFNGIESIQPITPTAKIYEILSYFVVGVFLLIIAASVIFSLKQDKIKENVSLTLEICENQNQFLQSHIEKEFGVTINTALKEISDIKKSIENLRNIMDKLF